MKLGVILDYAVMDELERFGSVGVRVRIARCAVGRPACMTDAAVRSGCFGVRFELFLDVCKPARRFNAAEVVLNVEESDSGRIVAAVLERPEPLDYPLYRIFLTCITYDTTHIIFSFMPDILSEAKIVLEFSPICL